MLHPLPVVNQCLSLWLVAAMYGHARIVEIFLELGLDFYESGGLDISDMRRPCCDTPSYDLVTIL